MQYPKQKTNRLWILSLLVPLFVSGPSLAGSLPKPLKSLYDDTRYAPACSAKKLKDLLASVRQLAGKREPEGASQVVQTLLCEEGPKAERFFHDHAAKRITSSTYGTGEEKPAVQTLDRDASLLLKKQVWEAKAVEEGDGIGISYRKNEACMAGFKLRFEGSRWMLIAMEEACD